MSQALNRSVTLFLHQQNRLVNLETEEISNRRHSKRKPHYKMNYLHIIVIIITCVAFLILGFLIGWFSHPKLSDGNKNSKGKRSQTEKLLLKNINKDKIKENLRLYSSRPRLSGTPGEKELVDELQKTWKLNGLDVVSITPYDVLLSYPNKSVPNKIEILGKNDKIIFTSKTFEKPLTINESTKEVIPPYNSFAPKGTVRGELVYVNYGTLEDFQYLSKNLSINFTGKIVIARYGHIFRGDKLKNAALYNSSGIILYTDPSDFNMNNSRTYPDTWWLPPSGVQRGTVGDDGDYLTPFYPATSYAHRLDKNKIKLPPIPCQPIGYGDAKELLRKLKGPVAPNEWQGKLGFHYKIGPGFTVSGQTVKLAVNNYEEVRTTWNVIGYIRGVEEPDRYVLLGNHHDTWVYGTIDPLSGAAVLTELTRVFGDLMKKGWRPRRTIVFCSWGGEEQGLIGSTEWVEEHMKVLYERAVAYLNLDYAVDFTYALELGTSPLLQDAMYQAAKKVPNPDPTSSFKSLYGIWSNRKPSTKGDLDPEPSVYYSLGSGSDMATFYQRAGVPSVDFWYSYDTEKWPILSYPLYHSAYETFYSFTKFIDPSFNYTLAVGQLMAIAVSDLADADILPFDVRRYSAAVVDFVNMLLNDFEVKWKKNKVNYEFLRNASKSFVHATEKFHMHLQLQKARFGPLAVRIINDKMMQLERAFIDPEGLPGRRQYKHVLFAPLSHNAYKDGSFPGIRETMMTMEDTGKEDWDLLKQQVYIATYTVFSAAETLENIGL